MAGKIKHRAGGRGRGNEARGVQVKQLAGIMAAVLAAVVVVICMLLLTWNHTQDLRVFVTLGAIAILLIVVVFAFVAALTDIFDGTQLKRILLAVLEKVPALKVPNLKNTQAPAKADEGREE